MQNTSHQSLERFIKAQENNFLVALAEVSSGKKRTHWMWYIFPQIQGLGFSDMAKLYAIRNLSEASAFLNHRVLGPRLILITSELLKLNDKTAYEIFGSPDDLKLHSCITLFAAVPGADQVFQQTLDKYFSGHKDNRTLKILALQSHV